MFKSQGSHCAIEYGIFCIGCIFSVDIEISKVLLGCQG